MKLSIQIFISLISTFAFSQELDKPTVKDTLAMDVLVSKMDSLIKVDSIPKMDTILKVEEPKRWKVRGDNVVLLNQSSYSEWVSGGNTSFGLSAKIAYDLEYLRGSHSLSNKIVFSYGQISNEGDKPRKTEDELFLSSSYAYQLKEKWYLSSTASIKTQIANGYDYVATPNYTSSNRISSFMAPGYLTLGQGVDYKPNKVFKISFLPLTAKATLVMDRRLQKAGKYGLKKDGDAMFLQLGAMIAIEYKLEVMRDIIWRNRLTFFDDYISSDLGNIDFSYETSIRLQLNPNIATLLTFNMLYDQNQLKKVQMKQTLGLGFTYSINKEKKKIF